MTSTARDARDAPSGAERVETDVEAGMVADLFRLVVAIGKAFPARALLSCVVLAALSLTEGVGLLCLVPLLQLVGVGADQGSLGGIVAGFGRLFGLVGLKPTLISVLALYVALAVVQSVLQRWQTTITVGLTEGYSAKLRTGLYRAIVNADWVFVSRTRASECTYMLTQAIDRVGAAVQHLLTLLVGAAIALAYLALALRVSPVMTMLVAVAAGALAIFARSRFGIARATGAAMSRASADLYRGISEHLGSLKTAKSYAAVARQTDIFVGLVDEQQQVNRRMALEYAGFRQRLAFGLAVVMAVVVYVASGVLAIPTAQLLLLLFLFARLMPRITSLYETSQYAVACVPAFREVLDFEGRCLAAREPAPALSDPLVFEEQIRLDHVTFDYGSGSDRPAVDDVTCRIEVGRTTAIVGPSGAGKSTIADLLLGLLTPTAGQVTIDGAALTAGLLPAWRNAIGYVPQETFLFHDTVRANLLWARPTASEPELWAALASAQADRFVARLPQQLDTILGDRGVLLSGGERQRLSLARALLRAPRILILDEATSALDSENETRIHDAIETLHHAVTIVIITHRLTTIRNADVIHVIDDGRLVESGTWATLAAGGGRFLSLCRAQGLATDEVAFERRLSVAD